MNVFVLGSREKVYEILDILKEHYKKEVFLIDYGLIMFRTNITAEQRLYDFLSVEKDPSVALNKYKEFVKGLVYNRIDNMIKEKSDKIIVIASSVNSINLDDCKYIDKADVVIDFNDTKYLRLKKS
ncbi:MAG: hypothetical protein MR779_03785 [Tenericutes bacterium]|nr:hypothetical protein [Mycoplasmatota bacterium]